MKKRIISALLAAAMVFALLPTVAWAAADVPFKNNGGNGTAGAPYLIANLDQLEAFQKYINDGKGSGEYFKLTATIDMSSKYSVGSGTSWTPIGTDDNPFSGTFDGGGFEISGLYINTEDYYKGLFGYSTGTIKNLTVSGSVTGGTYTGGIVGENDGGSVENCCNKSAVNGVSSTSGIAGYNKGGSIENCYNTGAVTGTGNRIGGIAGNNSGSVKNCYNTGTVSGAGYVGGIVGENSGAVIVGSDSGSIENCYNTGTVSSKDTTYTGGIAGSSGGSVKKCYYLDTCGAKGRFGGTSKTADQFASGEVAYLLQNGQDAQVWGQKLSDGADEYPVLTSDKSKKVLKVTFLSDSAEHAVRYTNPNGTVTLPEEPAKTNYTFEKWSQSNDAAGAEFNEKTLVTEDITVYAVGRDHFGGDSADITLSRTYGYADAITVNLDEHMKYANRSIAAAGKFEYSIESDINSTSASIVSDNTLNVPVGLNVGDYTITVTATEKTSQYSLMSVDSYGTEDVTLTVKVSITKAAASVTVAPTAKDLTYDGTEQELVTAGETEDGTIQYSLDNADYSTNIPKGTEAKAYTVWYKVVGDSNHNDSTPQSVGVTIKKANSEVTVADSSATYGDTLTLKADVKKSNAAGISLMSAEQDKVDFKAGETSLGTATVEYSDSELKSIGTARLTVTVDKAKYNAIKAVNGKITAEYGGSVNLNESTKDNITVTLNKKTLTYTATATNRKYNGEKTVEVTLTPTNANGDTVTLTATGTIDDANVGDGKSVTITGVTVGGEDAEYYQAADAPIGAVTVNIEKADSTVTAPTAKTDLTYNGTAQELLETAGSATGGELQYKVDEGTYSTAAPTATTAGEHTVYYKVVENDNYNGIAEASIKVTIAKATPIFPEVGDVDGGTYEPGKKLSDVTVPEVDGGTLAWSEGETALNAGANSVQAVFTPDNSENYDPTSVTDTVTVNVAKATITGVAVQDVTAQFDETQPEKQYTLAAPTGTIEGDAVRYAEGDYNEANDSEADWQETCPSYSDEGTDQTITVRIERENYNTLYLKATIKITNEPAISGVDVTENDGLVYNGGAQELVTVTGSLGTDTVTYYVNDDPTGSTEKAMGTNAGSYSVKVKVEREGHHHFEKTVEVTIAKANSTAVVTPRDLTYTGAAQELVSGSAEGGELQYCLDGSIYSADIPIGTEAKAYTVWYKVAGDANHNDTEPDKVEVTIAQATATVTAPTAKTPLTYNGTAQELITAGSVTSDVLGYGEMRYSLDGDAYSAHIPMGESAQAYTVYWKVDGADETNYMYSAKTSGQVEVTIAKAAAQVIVPPAARDLTYTGEEQALVTAGESSFGALAYSLAEAGPFTDEIPTATEAGTYTVYYMVEGSDNWNASPVGNVPVEIHPADSSATVRRRTGLVYSGQPQALVTAGNVTGGQLVYALGEDAELVPASGYESRTPTATDAGTYYVWWKILGDVDHGDTEPACLTVTIAPFPLTLEPVAVQAPYTGAAASVPVTQTAGQTPAIDPAKIIVSYEQNGAAAEPILPGIYDVLVAVTDPNFTLAGAAKVGTLTITHVHAYGEEWAYDESNHWHVCQGVGPCDAPRSDLAAHQLTWVDTGDGTGRQVCTVCGYVVGEHTHASETWRVDEENGQHYKTCDACGAAFDRADHALTWVDADPALHWQACAVCGWAGEKSAHAWDEGVVTLAPTAEAEGSRLYTCAVCGATRSEPISKLDTFQISGAVTDQAGAPLPRAAVRLTRGSETVAETVTDDQGRYSFSSVPAGLYNVAATWEDVTKTILVELSDADADQRDIQMPSGKVSSVVEVLGEDTPDVVVGGVDAIAEAEATSPAETVTVTLTVAKQEEPTDKDEIDQLITGQRDNVLYLDVSLLKQINTQPTQAITDTGVRVLEIIVPYDFTGKRSVTVYRKHGDDPAAALTALSARPDLAAAEDGTFFADQENGWIAIYASKFSTYAIGYQTASSGASSVARYVLTATAGEGGTIDPAGAIRVRRGADQSYAIRPEAGYEVADVLVDGASVGAVTAYTFENVAAAHTIWAVFRKAGESSNELPFTDVAPGDWFYDSVKEVYQCGLMQGVAATTFAPAQGATRATVVTILYRLAGSPATQADLAYADVSGDAWYAQAIRWAEETGVAIGYGDGRFGPDDPITREQLAVMLWRYAAAQGRDVSVGENTNILSYQDFDQIADWAIPGLQWAAGSGVLQGAASGATLSPKAPATRAELATVLARYCEAATEETNEAE